jgi:hypothetical protein
MVPPLHIAAFTVAENGSGTIEEELTGCATRLRDSPEAGDQLLLTSQLKQRLLYLLPIMEIKQLIRIAEHAATGR